VHARIQITSICFAVIVLLAVFELVRRRRLSEKYALVWMSAGLALLILAIWQQLLYKISDAVGIYYPPTAFLVIAFGFLLLLILNLSIASSRLGDDTRLLAQRLAMLEASLTQSERKSHGDIDPGHLSAAVDLTTEEDEPTSPQQVEAAY
jgi:hypothetical protein